MKRSAFTALALLLALAPAFSQAVSPARVGIQPTMDPEGVFILDKNNTWVTIGSTTGGVFTPVAGGGTPFSWPGTADVNTPGAAPAGGLLATMPYVNAYLPGLLPAFQSPPTVNIGTVGGIALSVNQPSIVLPGDVTASQNGNLEFGKAQTSVSMSDGHVYPLSLDPATGGIRVLCVGSSCSSGASTAPFIPGVTPISAFFAVSTSTSVSIPGGSTTLIVGSSSLTPNILHCTLGAGPATNNDVTIQPGGSWAFNVTGISQFSCVTSSGTQLVTATAGSGFVTPTAGITPNLSAPGTASPQLAGVQSAIGALPFPVKPGFLTPAGTSCQLTVSSASAIQTSACAGGIPTGSTYAFICNEGGAVRWRDDGTNPTSAVGQILGTGAVTQPICAGFTTTLSTLAWIAETGSSTVDVSFYK